MKIRFTLLLFLSSSVFISAGCSALNSTLDCPMTPGIRCASLDEVNKEIDQRKAEKTISCKHCPNSTDHYQRIWLAPYSDENEHYYPATFMNMPNMNSEGNP